MRIVVASDSALYREALAEALSIRPGLVIVGLASCTSEVMGLAEDRAPDILLLDSGLPGGIECARRFFDLELTCQVVVIGLGESDSDLLAWATSGVSGFVTRESRLADLARTLTEVAEHRWRSSPGVLTDLLQRVARISREGQESASWTSLTSREQEVMQLLGRGGSNKEIARTLGIALPTVKNHVHNILTKLSIRRRSQAVEWLYREGPRRATASRAKRA